MAIRVSQWATGNVGKNALRSIISHPELELVGLVVSDPAKVGKDAAEICGLDTPTGIIATDDGNALIALKPDCVSFCSAGTSGREGVTTGNRQSDAADHMCDLLRAGINVVSTAIIPLVHPGSADQEIVRRLEAACREGGTTCFTSGLDPGFMHDILPLALSGVTRRIDTIRVSEVMSYGVWDKPDAITGKFGFGKPIDEVPPIARPGVLDMMWGSVVRLIAEQLGLTLDRTEEYYELYPAPETFTIPAGTIVKGSSAGIRFEVRGIVAGKAAVVVEHVTRLRVEDAPHWPKGPIGIGGGYRVQISGDPDWVLEVGNPGYADPTVPGTLATALRIVNAIPVVVAAPPGVVTPFDLPMITGKGLVAA
ncbi:NAD(P)H-dependent amine dehydrogenase family protein [Rhizorhabdus histidinilytica]|uniref:NAD(P)H-dependent amine dehydrogenase family protein n=1 Tax=Rhizorhabdus histidinilytica TaxID=439228 RepID=UPI00321F7068